MLRTTTAAWCGLVLFFASADVVRAQDASTASTDPLAGSYHFTGNYNGSDFLDGTLTLTPAPGGYAASGVEKRKSGSVSWIGSGTSPDGKLLTIERPEGTPGIVGALTNTGTTTTIEYLATWDKDKDSAPVRVYRKDAAGKATEIGTATIEQHVPFWERLPGDLLAFEQKIVDQAEHKEVDLSKSFAAGTYTALGIKIGAQWLPDSARTSFMQESDRAFIEAGKGAPIWVHTVVSGGPTVSWGHTIPIGSSGVSLAAGFSAGVTLSYVCDDQLASPTGLEDVAGEAKLVEDVPAKAFFLPSNADKALALAEGTRRTLEGTGSLTLSGGAAFGYRLSDLGALTNQIQVGVDAGINVSFGLNGDLKLDVERQNAELVHLRWTKGGSISTNVGVSFLLGLYVAPSLQSQVDGKLPQQNLTQSAVNAVVQKGEAYTCVQFNLSRAWLDAQTLVIDAQFDLSDAAAQAAYNDAVLGDLRACQALAATKGQTGLKQLTFTTTATDALTYTLHFNAFQVVNYDASTQRTDVHVDVETMDGTKSATSIYSYGKKVSGFFAKLFGGGDRSLGASATDRVVTAPDGRSTSGEQVSFTFDQTIDNASHEKVDEELAMAGSLFGEDKVAGDVEKVHATLPKKGYGKAQVHLDATLGTTAITKVLAAGDEGFYEAYGRAAAPGETTHAWDAARVQMLEKVSLIQKNDATPAEEDLRLEAWDLYYARGVAKLLDKARAASSDQSKQVEQFREIAKKTGFDLRTLVALVELSGADAKVDLSVKATGLDFEKSNGQAAALPDQPF